MQNETVGFFNGRSIIEKSVKASQNKSAWVHTLYQKIYGNYDHKQFDDDKYDSMKAFKAISLRMGQHFRSNEDIQSLLNNNLVHESSAVFLDNGDMNDETLQTTYHKRSYTNAQLPSMILSPSMMRNDTTEIRKSEDTSNYPEFFATRPSYNPAADNILASPRELNPFYSAITGEEIKVIDDDPTAKKLALKNQSFSKFNKRVLKLKSQVGLAVDDNKTLKFSKFNRNASEKILQARVQVEELSKATIDLQEKIRKYRSKPLTKKQIQENRSSMNMMEYFVQRQSIESNDTQTPEYPSLPDTQTKLVERHTPVPLMKIAEIETDGDHPIPEPSPIQQLENNETYITEKLEATLPPIKNPHVHRVSKSVKKHFFTPKADRRHKSNLKLDTSKSEITIIQNLQSVTKRSTKNSSPSFRFDSSPNHRRGVQPSQIDIYDTETGQPRENVKKKNLLPMLPKVRKGSKEQEEFRKIYISCMNIHENLSNMDKKLFHQTTILSSSYQDLNDKLIKIKRTTFLPQNIVLDGI